MIRNTGADVIRNRRFTSHNFSMVFCCYDYSARIQTEAILFREKSPVINHFCRKDGINRPFPLFFLMISQLLYVQCTDCIQNRNHHHTYIGKNRKPHICDTNCSKTKAGKFNDQRKNDILLYNTNAFF